MSFADVWGDANAVAQDLYDRATEPAQGSVDSEAMANRLARKTGFGEDFPYNSYEARRQRLLERYNYKPGVTPLKSEPPPQDFSSEGTLVDTSKIKGKPDFSTEAGPEPAAPEQPEKPEEQPPPLTAGEQVAAAGKAAAQTAAAGLIADPLKAAAMLPEMEKEAYAQGGPKATLEGGGYAGRPQTPEEAEAAGPAYGVAGGPFRSAIKARERQQEAAQDQLAKETAVPPQERPLYKFGEEAQKKIEKAIPLTDQEKESVGAKIGSFLGGVVPAVGLTLAGAAVGMPELGMVAGGVQMGAQAAGASFEKALNAGATPEEAARAAGLDGLVSGALGLAPLGAILAPVRAAGTPILDLAGNEIGRKVSPGLLGWMAAKLEQGVKSGVIFAGVGEAQEWLSKQIASDYNASAREKLRTDQAKIQTEIDKVKSDPKLAEANKDWLKQAEAAVKEYDKRIENPSQYELDPDRVLISFFGGGAMGMLHPHGMAREMPPPDQWPQMPPDPSPGTGAGGGPGPGAAGGAGAAGAGAGTTPPRPPPADTPRQARMRAAFEKGLSDAGINEPNLPFDELRDLYQTVDGLRTGFGRTDLAGKSPADLKTLFEQLSLLKGHGFTADELRTMSPADVSREYAQAVREGARPGEPPPAAEPQQPPEAETPPGQAEAGVQQPAAGAAGPVTGEQPVGEPAAAPGPQAAGTRDDPIELKTGDDVARAAAVASQTHSHEQGEAHNVQQGYGTWNGLHIAFEAPSGGIRRGTNPRTGEPWEGRVGAATGYIINGPPGNDGDKLDVYVGSNPSNPTVWVLDELDEKSGKFRQTKSFIGFDSPAEAVNAYLSTDNKGAQQVGGITPMLQPDFVNWVHNGDHSKPVRDVAPERGEATAPFPLSSGGPVTNPIEVEPHHVKAIEDAITAAGHPIHDVSLVDIHLAAEYHAMGVRDPREAFQLAFWKNGIEQGWFTPEDIADVYGEEAAQATERLPAETVGGPSGDGAVVASEGTAYQPAVSGENAGPGKENRVGEGAGAHGPREEGTHAAPATLAGGAEATGAAPAGERGAAGAHAGAERPEPAHGGERPAAERPAGTAGERPGAAETHPTPAHAEHAEAAGAAAHGAGEGAKGEAPETAGANKPLAGPAEPSGPSEHGEGAAPALPVQTRRAGKLEGNKLHAPKNQAKTAEEASEPQVKLVQAIAKVLDEGKNITSRRLQELATQAYGGKLAEGKFDRKDMYDALETAVNVKIAKDPAFHLGFRAENAMRAELLNGRLEKLLDGLPTQTVRSEEQQRFQQFSTPPNYAMAVAYAAGLRDGDVVLEPSAGTGSLVAAATHPGVTIHANELSPRRAALLREVMDAIRNPATGQPVGKLETENAEQLNNVLPADVKPTVVVMNPPFSQTAGRMGDRKDIMVGANHIEQALARLEPGGRLVAIVGRGMAFGVARFQPWWKKISQKYAVRANIGVEGGVYKKYGTQFGTRLLVIDKIFPEGQPSPLTAEVKSVPELMKVLEGIRNARPIAEQRPSEPGRPEVAQGGENAGISTRPPHSEPGGLGAAQGGAAGVPEQGPGGGGAAGGAPPELEAGGRPGVAGGQSERPEAVGAGARPAGGAAGGVKPGGRGGGAAEPHLQPAAGGEPGAAAGGQWDLAKLKERAAHWIDLNKRTTHFNFKPDTRERFFKDPEALAQLLKWQAEVDADLKSAHDHVRRNGGVDDAANPGKGRPWSGEIDGVSYHIKNQIDTIERNPQGKALLDAARERLAKGEQQAAGAAGPPPGERAGLENVAPGEQKKGEITESLYESYQPQKVRVKGAKPHPGPLVESASMASVPPPDATYQPHLPKAIIDKGLLSTAQLEPVVYAGQAHSQMLPASEGETARRKGFFIGDGTGVGKGRQIAGIILDNWNQGRKRAVWVSEKKTLMQDAKRDWGGLEQDPNLIFDMGKVKAGEPIKAPQGIAFVTYDTLKGGMSDQAALAQGGFVRGEKVTFEGRPAEVTGKPRREERDLFVPIKFEDGERRSVSISALTRVGEKQAVQSRVDQLVDWFGKDFDGVVAFDECVPAGTMISTPNGPRAIETLSVGDIVYGFDHEANAVTLTKVMHTFRRTTSDRLYNIGPVSMTGNHPVWTENRGYVRADSLVETDVLLYKPQHGERKIVRTLQDGIHSEAEGAALLREVLQRESDSGSEILEFRSDQESGSRGCDDNVVLSEVFNIETGSSNYFANALLVHNCHNLGNATQTTGVRGLKQAAQKALAGIQLQGRLPNARVVYVSATGATEVSNLAYADRLGLWGRGTPFASRANFVSEVESGGIAAMELIARDMKQMGLYTARNLSYDGVEYSRLEHALSKEQREIYNALARAWQHVLRNINAALELTGGDKDSRAKSAAYSAFWGAHQRFFNQIVTSLQMPSVIKAVEKDLREGRQAVLQLTNTNEASQERAAAKAETAEDIEDLDITPRDQIIQLIEKSFPTQAYEKFMDEEGNEGVRPVFDSQGNPVQDKQAVEMRDRLIDQLASIRVPQGPLDMILDHFGHENVAEVTGRGRRFIMKEDQKGVRRRMEESRPASANLGETDAFQSGKKKILVFSEAGGTGRSYHADNTAASKNARRSHYLVQGGWRADKAVQGFGRTHRTNQASAPIFNLVTTDLSGQKRFISSIARRLAQLGALTKGQRQAGDQGIFSARDNLESTEARFALRQFFSDLFNRKIEGIGLEDFENQTGLKLTQRDEEGAVQGMRAETPEITQFLNRLLSLDIDTQNKVFEAFSDRLDDVIEARRQAGILDQGLETLRADKIRKDSEKTVYKMEGSGAETKHVKLTVSDKFIPIEFKNVANNERKPVEFWATSPQGRVYAVTRTTSHTDDAGNIIDNYRIINPTGSRIVPQRSIHEGLNAPTLTTAGQQRKKWAKIQRPDAEKLWQKEIEDAPEFIDRDLHLITGTILPVWDRIKGQTRVVRTQTDDGERLLGRVIPNSQVSATLMALGAEDESTKVEPGRVFEVLLSGGKATLANGWRLTRRVVAGEHRIELTGPSTFSEGQQLQQDGVFTERIAYQNRYFIPTDEVNGPKVLERITKYRPITSLEGGGGTIEENSLATFGGARGATANLSKLEGAKAMEAAGGDPQHIWEQTGWWHRRDGWRYEIDDSKVRFKPGALQVTQDRYGREPAKYEARRVKGEWVVWNVTKNELSHAQQGGYGKFEAEQQAERMNALKPRTEYRYHGPLGDLIEAKGFLRSRIAPVLEAYPHLADASVDVTGAISFLSSGGYDHKTNRIQVDGNIPDQEELLKTLLHEIQHAVQAYEGFAQGGHGKSLLSRTRAALYDLDQQIKSLRPGSNIRAELEQMRGRLKEQEELFGGGRAGFGQTNEQSDSYMRLLGEVEARNTEWRRKLTPDERLANPPWKTEDVPAEEQYGPTDLVRVESKHAGTINRAVNEEWRNVPAIDRNFEGISLSPQYSGENRPQRIAGSRSNITASMKFTPQDVADKIRVYGAQALSDHLQQHIDYRRNGPMMHHPETGELVSQAEIQKLIGYRSEPHEPPEDQIKTLEAIKGVVDRVMERHPETAKPSGYTVTRADPEGLLETYSGRTYTEDEFQELRYQVIAAIEKMGEAGELTPEETRDLSYDFGAQGLGAPYGIDVSYPEQFKKLYARHKALIDEYQRAFDYRNYAVSRSNAGLSQKMRKPERYAREIMTPRALQTLDQIKAAIVKHIQDMVGTKAQINVVDAGDLGPLHAGWGAAFEESKVTGAEYRQRSETWNDVKIPLQGVINIALHSPSLSKAINHEAVHALIDLAATDAEIGVLKRERPRNRKIVQDHLGLTDQEVNNIAGFEIDAIAGEIYMGARDYGEPGTKFSFHVAIRALFERLWKLLRQIGNALRRMGFQTSEDIYRRMHEGEMADRPFREEQGINFKEDLAEAGQHQQRVEEALQARREEARAQQSEENKLSSVGFLGTDRIVDVLKDFWTSTFQPELVSDRALEADPLFARYKSAQAQEKDAIIKQFDEGWKHWNKKPVGEGFRFLHTMERARYGATTGNAYEDAMMHTWRRLLDENWADEQRWGSRASFVQDYVPHVWERPDQWRMFAERQAAQLGPTWFQKGRTFDYISEGLAHGLKLRYTNPADLIVHRLLSGVDMRQRMQLLYALKPMGLAWEGVQGGQQLARRGWQPINAPDRKQWMIHPDAQKLWKNAVEAQGLWAAEGAMGNIFRGWMVLKNAWVPIKLSLSAFHPLHVLHINQAQMLTLAARSARRGDLAGALKEVAEGLATIPTLGIPSMRKGAIIKQAWEKRPADQTAQEKAIIGLINEMGITAQLSEQLRIAGKRKFAESWARIMRGEGGLGDWASLLPSALRRAVEVPSAAIFEHWIPALKVNAALMEAHDALARDPTLLNDPTRRRLALRAIGKSIDNRFGEMFYGSLFWDRYVKDAGIASFLSLGWNLGFVREFIGGAGEALTRPVRAAGRLTGIQAIAPSQQRQTVMANTSKMGFVFTYLMSAALINGLMSYLLSGKPPEGWDWIFARIGGENPDGSPRRITNMTYLREIPMLIKHIEEHGGNVLSGLGEMIWSKMLFEPIKEVWENRDFFGYNIYDENAPFYRQAWETIKHYTTESTPISISSAQRALDTGGTWSKDVVLSVLGFGPAPAYVEKSAIQNRISHLYNEHVAPQSKTYQEGEVSHEKMRARTRLLMALQSHDPEAIKQAKDEAIKAGYSNTAVGAIGRTPSDVYLFSRLPPADQEAILRQADDQEFERYINHAQMKLRKPMRDERAGKPAEAPRAAPSVTLQTPSSAKPATPSPAPAPRGNTPADRLLKTSPLRQKENAI